MTRYEDVQDVLRYQLSRQLNRRTVLGAGGALALGGLAACSDDGGSYADDPANSQQPDPEATINIGKANIPTEREKTLIVAQVQYTVFNSWNPFVPNGMPGGAGFELCREALFYMNLATGEIVPWLATEHSYNDDFTTLTINLDPRAKWSDGEPLTSTDVQFTVRLLRDRNDLIDGGGDWTEFVDDVDAPDDHTAVIKLKKPNPRFHYFLYCAIQNARLDIRPAHIWKDQDPTKFKDNPPIRTGPYQLKEAMQDQKMFVWEKNPNYWNKENLDPKPEYVIYQSTATQADSAALSFERAEVDCGSIDEQHAKQLRTNGYPALITTQFNDPCPRAFWVNCDPSRGIVSEPKMRWVISYLTDRPKIGTNVWPVEVAPAQYPWADYPSLEQWKVPEIAEKYPLTYDPAKAEQLLDEIAPKGDDGKRTYDGKPIKIEIMTSALVDKEEYVIGSLLAEELEKLGVPAAVRSLSGSVHDEKFQLGNFDITSNWVCETPFDPEQMYRNMESDRAADVGKNAVNRNKIRFRNSELDTLSKQLANMDPTSPEAKPLLDQALEVYFQNLPIIPIIQTGYPSYYNTTFWQGWPTDDDLFQVPLNWWGQFMFILGRLESTGQEEP